MPDPEDPITALAQSAVGAHEMFIAFVGAGFTDSQALYLVGQVMVSAMHNPTG
jgi:hypothetical protein